MRPFMLLFVMAVLLAGCLPEIEVGGEVDVDDACVVVDTTQQENLLCILGELRLCRCPSPDPSVQAQCNDFSLPDRAAPPPSCK